MAPRIEAREVTKRTQGGEEKEEKGQKGRGRACREDTDLARIPKQGYSLSLPEHPAPQLRPQSIIKSEGETTGSDGHGCSFWDSGARSVKGATVRQEEEWFLYYLLGVDKRHEAKQPLFLSESSLTPSLIWNGNREERRFASQKPLPKPWLLHWKVRSFHLTIGSQTFGFPGPVLGSPGDQSAPAASSGATLSPSTLQTRGGDRNDKKLEAPKNLSSPSSRFRLEPRTFSISLPSDLDEKTLCAVNHPGKEKLGRPGPAASATRPLPHFPSSQPQLPEENQLILFLAQSTSCSLPGVSP
ncbi:uncharacterized protein LOC127680378 [Apodemus sylvaticus]|uniref:uncharacterized protein LOC127680378 n=1 Tax=Apodemus sylvaticus TaxID=10129 RepID=UPI002244F4AD|nr:uncharacterized protein LOC127680378 [Apodemus sylvaticus]